MLKPDGSGRGLRLSEFFSLRFASCALVRVDDASAAVVVDTAPGPSPPVHYTSLVLV